MSSFPNNFQRMSPPPGGTARAPRLARERMWGHLRRNHYKRPLGTCAELPPDRHELFLLEDDEKKVEWKDETRKC